MGANHVSGTIVWLRFWGFPGVLQNISAVMLFIISTSALCFGVKHLFWYSLREHSCDWTCSILVIQTWESSSKISPFSYQLNIVFMQFLVMILWLFCWSYYILIRLLNMKKDDPQLLACLKTAAHGLDVALLLASIWPLGHCSFHWHQEWSIIPPSD